MSIINPDLRYTSDHEWVSGENPAAIGISQLAADQLGEMVYLDLPEVGSAITVGETFGEIESTKSVSELYAPVTGTVIEVNDAAVDDPAIINADAYAAWLIKVNVETEGELLSAADYAAANDVAL